VVAIGLQAPIVTVLAFVPMLLIAIAYQELNKADPDCGTTFTWATRAFGPRTGWLGGWGIVAADVLVMASLAQVAGQYVFLLFNTGSIGNKANSGWVLLVGILWIVAMTYICYRGIEVSATFQKVLLSVEVVLLFVLSIWALVKVGNGTAPIGDGTPRSPATRRRRTRTRPLAARPSSRRSSCWPPTSSWSWPCSPMPASVRRASASGTRPTRTTS
jgi:amino acid transporter